MTNLQFWGGLRQIGGTIVSVEYGDARVIFDFGLGFNPAENFFDGQVHKREDFLVKDYLKLNLIPRIDGVYSEAALSEANQDILPAERSEKNTIVIISHLHLDHIGAMGLIDPSIPVYFTKESKDLYDALVEIGEGVPGERAYHTCEYGTAFSVGEINITPLHVDHDIPGACGYHIQTPDGSLVYSGDLRLHGKNPELTHQFITEVKALGVDAMIMEGTTLSSDEEIPEEKLKPNPAIPDDLLTEDTLISIVAKQLRETKGIAVFNIYHRNVARILGMIEAAKQTGRTAVLEAGTAKIISKLTDVADVIVYQNKTKTEIQAGEYQTITAEEINLNPQAYFLQNSYENTLELFDFNVEGGVYIHSNGVPLGPFDPAYENLQRILAVIQLPFVAIGISGHAIPAHLKYIVDEIDPAILIPLHSFHPERLLPKNGIQFLPEYGVRYALVNKEGSPLGKPFLQLCKE